CFFFSSRGRHTISYGDWSSDVCSSDLSGVQDPCASLRNRRCCSRSSVLSSPMCAGSAGSRMGPELQILIVTVLFLGLLTAGMARSEERRVGYELTARGWRGEPERSRVV